MRPGGRIPPARGAGPAPNRAQRSSRGARARDAAQRGGSPGRAVRPQRVDDGGTRTFPVSTRKIVHLRCRWSRHTELVRARAMASRAPRTARERWPTGVGRLLWWTRSEDQSIVDAMRCGVRRVVIDGGGVLDGAAEGIEIRSPPAVSARSPRLSTVVFSRRDLPSCAEETGRMRRTPG